MNRLYRTNFFIKALFLFALWLCVSSFVASKKSTSSLHAAAFFDTTVCGGPVTVTATSGLTNYKWSTGATTRSITVTTSGNYWWETTDFTDNRVANGNFSSGFTGFTSSYTVPPGPVSNTTLYTEGTYYVIGNPNTVHSSFSSFFDHTSNTSSGKMMVINGASVPNVTVWAENITVTPNTTYVFSVWFASVYTQSPGQLNFSINGSPLGSTIQLSSTTGLWQNFTITWNSGSNTTAAIGLVNQNTAASGNDFALDDITFNPVYHHDIAVTINPIPVLAVNSSPAACVTYNLTTAITGYDPTTYTYTFKDSSNNIITAANAQAITTSGVYTVTGQNKATGCTSASKSITVTINPKPGKPSITP